MRGRTARRKMFMRYRRRAMRGRTWYAVHFDTAHPPAVLMSAQREANRRITKRNARFNRATRKAGFVVPARWETR